MKLWILVYKPCIVDASRKLCIVNICAKQNKKKKKVIYYILCLHVTCDYTSCIF